MTKDEQDREEEANYFAMCLLMPRDLVVEEVRKLGGVDLADDRKMGELAARFGVSISLMATRIGQLMSEKK